MTCYQHPRTRMLSKPSKFFTLVAAAFAATIFGPATLSATASNFDWTSYMQTGAMAGAVASAISQVDHCSKPLIFEEITTDDASTRILVFTCAGTEDEQGSAILRIQRFGDGPWMPMGFDFAG